MSKLHDWNKWIGTKYGTLTVKDYIVTGTTNNHRYFLCRCQCGKEKKVSVYDFNQGKVKSCGRLECKQQVAGIMSRPVAPKDARLTRLPSVIEARIKPKWFCKAVAPECTISALLHICCCECDRPCKRCSNTPEKCGARERQK
jgi:hypothetical protein